MKKFLSPALFIIVLIAVFAALQTGRESLSDKTPDPNANPGLATVEDIDILMLESFPLQVQVVVTGNLMSSCYEIGDINEIRRDRHFDVSVKTRMIAEVCAQALVPFEISIPLSVHGLKADRYTVSVNGAEGEFTFTQDNTVPEDGESNTDQAPVLPPGY